MNFMKLVGEFWYSVYRRLATNKKIPTSTTNVRSSVYIISKTFKTYLLFPTECDKGNFGQNCYSPCHCLNDIACDHINGSCPDSVCAPGWMGDNCSIGMN